MKQRLEEQVFESEECLGTDGSAPSQRQLSRGLLSQVQAARIPDKLMFRAGFFNDINSSSGHATSFLSFEAIKVAWQRQV